MAGAPDRSYSFNRNDEQSLQSGYQAYQPSSQPYPTPRDVSPIEGSGMSFPPPAQNMGPPPPPVHTYGLRSSQNYSDYSPPGITPGTDNLGEAAAGGGINGIAIGVANSNERESGVQALRDVNNWGRSGEGSLASSRGTPSEGSVSGTPFADQYGYEHAGPLRPPHPQAPYGSNAALMSSSASGSERSLPLGPRAPLHPSAIPYQDSPYTRYSSSNLDLAPQMGVINPHEADDEDDWGMGPQSTTQQQKRRSFVPFGASRDGSRESTPGPAAAVAGAGTGAAAYAATRDASGNYNAVPGSAAGGNGSAPELMTEKSAWLSSQKNGKKRLTWIVSIVILLVVVGAIVGGVLGTVLRKNSGGNETNASGNSAASVQADNKNDLDKNSDEIKKLMNNKALHKVFPGMDYTPLNSQYPDCLHVPPSQNNITRDMAVLGQMTNAVRLYGTDCNQTEMVLHSIDRLGLSDMKVWLGVWLGNNDTTNSRQVAQMWDILDNNKADRFKGIIIGNEVLYRKDLTEQELLKAITDVKSNLTSKNIDLPIATSDLGDNWTADMATKVDIVMSNVHPFFAGVDASVAASWTWDFWTQHDVKLTADSPNIKQIIAEVGWPSAGGKDCGAATCTDSTSGSVAGIDEMNTFMESWICQSLANGTEYFWFEAFDEPWKVQFNSPGKNWEDKWGLMDINRNLKSGVTIPDCGGKTAS